MTDSRIRAGARAIVSTPEATIVSLYGNKLTVQHDTGDLEEFTLNRGVSLKVEVTREAFVDGGVYVDAKGEILKYVAVHNGWRLWNRYQNAYDHEVSLFRLAALPVHRIDG